MKKVAFITPIYPPHYKYAYQMILSFNKCLLDKQADLWFVFSNEEEKDSFMEYEHSLVLDKNIATCEGRGIVNIKKLWAIKQLKNKYDYLIVVDSESMFIKNVDVYKLCQNYFSEKILLGNKTYKETQVTVNMVTQDCKKYFCNSPNVDLLDTDLYLWFNQPCIYKTDTIDEFYDVINFENILKDMQWHNFDYYIYMYYLILYQKFKIVDVEIPSMCGFAEEGFETPDFKSLKMINYNILSCSKSSLEYFDNPNLFLIFHIDRNLSRKIKRLTIRINDLESRIEKLKKRTLIWRLRRIISLFAPTKKLRKKIRGDKY